MENTWINKDFRLVDKRDDLGRALGWFRGETKTVPIVADGKTAYGIIDGRRVLGSGIRRTTKIDKVAQPVPILAQGASADLVIDALSDAMAPHVIIADGQRCLGYVDAASVTSALDVHLDADTAASFAASLPAEATVEDAIKAFTETNIALLPIVEESGYIAGIIRRADLVRLHEQDVNKMRRKDLAGQQTDLHAQPIEGIMDGGWTEIRADAGFEAISAIIEQEGYTLLTDGGRYAGILDGLRLIRAVKAETTEEALYGTATPHYRRLR